MAKKNKSKKASAQRWEKGIRGAEPAKEPRNLQAEFLWLFPALLLGFLIYTNTLGGEFVYDDQRQIVRNTLIQDGSQFWRALFSDVWAFKGGDQAVSNYWRPSFVVWMIANYRSFGLATFGWHLTNILLHTGVIALAFALLRRLKVSRPVAAAIALILAIHPVHTESVAWISGAPDLILAAALLGSSWFVLLLGERKTPLRWLGALGLYAVALGAKEVAILFPVVVVALGQGERRQGETSWSRSLAIAGIFAGVAVVYFIARQSILGVAERLPEAAANLGETILSAPAVFTFYLRQIVVPYWIGPSYPLRAVTTANIGLPNFVIPLIVTGAAGWWMVRAAERSKIARIGLALFLVPLLPAMYIAAFHPEQLVHDRYLYLPLLGFLILTIPALESLLERASRGPVLVLVFAAVISIPLAVQTFRYNPAWTSNLALWEWGVRSDPNSAFNYQQYGVQLHEAKRLDEAIGAFNRSIEIKPTAGAYLARGTTLIDRRNFAEAERDLRDVTSRPTAEVAPYTMYQAYEGLAVAFTSQGKFSEAATVIREAGKRLPRYVAALTEKLAVILYQNGQKSEALDELNRVRAQGRTEPLPESRLIFYRIGLLNSELGHPDEARAAFQEFLSLTQGLLTPEIKQARLECEAALRKLTR